MVIDGGRTYERVKYLNGFGIYKDHDSIPIEGVAEALNIDLRPNGSGGFRLQCPCPDHDDKNPSADISVSGKYENTFKCWSCNERGGPLELVMAVKNGITPSKFWDVMKSRGENRYSKSEYYKMIKARDDAAKFIEGLYPGAIKIEHIENGEKVEKSEELERPELPSDVWNELKNWVNIGRSVGFQKMIKVSDNAKMEEEKKNYGALDDYAYANLMYDKLCEVQNCLKAYKFQILHDFPELDNNARMVIINSIEDRVDKLDVHVERFRDYMMKVWDRDYPAEKGFYEDMDEDFSIPDYEMEE